MAENKTQRTDQSVDEFVSTIEPEKRREDSKILLDVMREQYTDLAMWGSGMIGASEYTYHYSSGRAGVWFRAGFAPRKSNLTIYLLGGLAGQSDNLNRLGKHKVVGSCLYINKLADINLDVLREMIKRNHQLIDELN